MRSRYYDNQRFVFYTFGAWSSHHIITRSEMQELMDNPYINLYSRHGILVCDQLSNEEARQIASQAALIHQALGFVLKDLIRVVSFKYADDDDAGDAQSSQ